MTRLPAIESRPAVDGIEVVRGDVTDWESLEASRSRIDTVVHAAALMLPNEAERIRRVNVEGTRAVVRFAQACGARRFIYFSAVSATYRRRNGRVEPTGWRARRSSPSTSTST
jgi:nucleoside-diphosphate-sugar epimerase